jgi:hypothetical protein
MGGTRKRLARSTFRQLERSLDPTMLQKLRFTFLLWLALAVNGACLPANTVSGRIMNQSLARPASGDEVILLRLGEGMQEVERTRSDAQGAFSFSAGVQDGDYLVRVVHQKVNYDQQLRGDSSPLQLAVYDAVSKISGLAGTMGIAQVESDGANLKVTEMYAISNVSNPPVTQANSHNFEISLPAVARLESFQVKRAGGVWVNATAMPDAGRKGRYSVDFPLRPGDTLFKFVYQLPYQSGTVLKVHLAYPVRNFGVVHPPSIVFKSSRPQAFTSPGVIKGLQLEQLVSDAMIHDVPAFELTGVGSAPAPAEPAQVSSQPAASIPALVNPVQDASPMPATDHKRNDQKRNDLWVVVIGMSVLVFVAIAFMVRRRRKSSARAFVGDEDEMSTAKALRDELSQLETEKLYGAISPEEYEVAKRALSISLQRAIARTQN